MNVSSAGSSGSAEVWAGASAPMSPTQKMTGLFDQIDGSGSGSITKAQLEQAFQTLNPPPSFQAAGADAIWAKLDPSGTGSVSKSDFVSTMTGLMKQLRGHHRHQHSISGASGLAADAGALNALGGDTGTRSSASGAGSIGATLDLLA